MNDCALLAGGGIGGLPTAIALEHTRREAVVVEGANRGHVPTPEAT
jgi:2-polyprenyl-6-methoxyphenol hydroxylase-like FAD-dependent oxidoreductase